MRFEFEDTGLRVRDLDAAIDFFTKVLGMKLEARLKADWTKGEFANLYSADGKHKLELNWYAPDSPVAGPFREGDELDHEGGWHIAFVPVVEGLWLDVFHVDPKPRKSQVRKKPT